MDTADATAHPAGRLGSGNDLQVAFAELESEGSAAAIIADKRLAHLRLRPPGNILCRCIAAPRLLETAELCVVRLLRLTQDDL